MTDSSENILNRLLMAVAQALARHRIDYMVTGGQAVVEYAEPRFTADVDITVLLDLNEVDHLVSSLPAGFVPRAAEPKRFVSDTGVLPVSHRETGIRFDFTFGRTNFEMEAVLRTRNVRIGNGTVRFIRPEDLVVEKVFAGRPKDLEDAKNILNAHPGLNQGEIGAMLKSFDRELGQNDLTERWRVLLESINR